MPSIKYIIVGLGSIGQRHCTNLLSFGVNENEIGVVRRKNGTNPFGDTYLKKHPEIQIYDDLDKALETKPRAVFVTNPTSLHLKTALASARAGSHLFIEKPISTSIDRELGELAVETERRNLVVLTGYYIRFNPLLQAIKQWIDDGKLGNIVSIQTEMSGRMPTWHPWEDYRTSYIASDGMSGGVILSLNHVIDLVYWFIGMPHEVYASSGTLGGFDIDTEDTADIMMHYKKGLTASVHLDYIKDPGSTFIEVTGTKGAVRWNIGDTKITLKFFDSKDTLESSVSNDFERNTMFLYEMKHFLDCIKNNKKSSIDLAQGKDVLAISLAARQSAKYHNKLITIAK